MLTARNAPPSALWWSRNRALKHGNLSDSTSRGCRVRAAARSAQAFEWGRGSCRALLLILALPKEHPIGRKLPKCASHGPIVFLLLTRDYSRARRALARIIRAPRRRGADGCREIEEGSRSAGGPGKALRGYRVFACKANSGGYRLWACGIPAAATVAATRQPAGCEDSRSPRPDRSGRLQDFAATFMNNAG